MLGLIIFLLIFLLFHVDSLFNNETVRKPRVTKNIGKHPTRMGKMNNMTYYRSVSQQLPYLANQISSLQVTKWFAKLRLTFLFLTLFCVQTEASLVL